MQINKLFKLHLARPLLIISAKLVDILIVLLKAASTCGSRSSFQQIRDPTRLGDHLFLNEVERRRHERHADEHVDGGSEHLQLTVDGVEVSRSGDDVAEPDGRQGNEAIIAGGRPAQFLPDCEEKSAEEDVDGHDDQGHGQRDGGGCDEVIVVFVIVVVGGKDILVKLSTSFDLPFFVVSGWERVVQRFWHGRPHDVTIATATTAAAHAAEHDVSKTEGVSNQLTNVGETEKHQRYAEQRVADAGDAAPERRRRNIAVTWE